MNLHHALSMVIATFVGLMVYALLPFELKSGYLLWVVMIGSVLALTRPIMWCLNISPETNECPYCHGRLPFRLLDRQYEGGGIVPCPHCHKRFAAQGTWDTSGDHNTFHWARPFRIGEVERFTNQIVIHRVRWPLWIGNWAPIEDERAKACAAKLFAQYENDKTLKDTWPELAKFNPAGLDPSCPPNVLRTHHFELVAEEVVEIFYEPLNWLFGPDVGYRFVMKDGEERYVDEYRFKEVCLQQWMANNFPEVEALAWEILKDEKRNEKTMKVWPEPDAIAKLPSPKSTVP